MSKQRKKPSEDELADFHRAVADVRRLRSDTVDPHTPRPPPVPRQTHIAQREVMAELLDHPLDAGYHEPGDSVSFLRPGFPRSIMRKLRRGDYTIGAEIDLHGHSAERAKVALSKFLNEAMDRHIRCVRVIHGKGHRSGNEGPVIKPLVARCLRLRSDVLAYCSARPIDGGTGALYVLLRP